MINKDDDDDGLSLLATLPLSLLIIIVNNLGTQEDLVNISVLSKQFHMIVHLPAIGTRIVRVYELSPCSIRNRGSDLRLVQRLVHNQLNNHDKFGHYHHFRLNRINEFDHEIIGADNDLLPINSITSFDLSLSSSSFSSLASLTLAPNWAEPQILVSLGNIFSNVQEINLSHVRFDVQSFQLSALDLRIFFNSLLSLQKITWHHCDRNILLAGFPLHPKRTKQIYADDSNFTVLRSHMKLMSVNPVRQLRNDIFMFHKCKSLECLSIRNARYTTNDIDDIFTKAVSQQMLIKFVRKAPSSMRWFRSDLTEDNMEMLRLERPNIELLN